MIVHISGERDAKIEQPFLIFKNDRRSYPIRGVPDTVPGVSYRFAPKGFIGQVAAPEWLKERRAMRALQNGRKR